MELEDEPAPSEAPELLEELELVEELLPPPPVIAPKTGCTRTKIAIHRAHAHCLPFFFDVFFHLPVQLHSTVCG